MIVVMTAAFVVPSGSIPCLLCSLDLFLFVWVMAPLPAHYYGVGCGLQFEHAAESYRSSMLTS